MSDDGLIRLCAESEVTEAEPMRVEVKGHSVVAVFKMGDKYHVTADECTHARASLAYAGNIEDGKMVCAWHNCEFDLETGEIGGLPCTEALAIYTPIVKDGVIYFDGKPKNK